MYLSHLISLYFSTGRRFVYRPNCYVIAEAKFDKEALSSDPVPHNEQPCFQQELAWELTKQSLRQHRLQRTSINLQLFSIDQNSPVKEPIGYIVLDLRSASDRKVKGILIFIYFIQISKWYKLLNSKYKGNPELYCGLYIDNDGHNGVLPSQNERKYQLVIAFAHNCSVLLLTDNLCILCSNKSRYMAVTTRLSSHIVTRFLTSAQLMLSHVYPVFTLDELNIPLGECI